jgi:uncharacterized coiled-coil protein SlyX
MSSTDQRIEAVEAQLGSLLHSVSQLNSSMTQMLGNLDSIRDHKAEATPGSTGPSVQRYSGSFSHKDVIDDGDSNGLEMTTNGQLIMPPEMQVQRLTAQLTAAYSRIAALEEQLLSRRVQ